MCSGTYKTIGKTIICYAEGVEYNRYNVLSLSENERERNMSMEGNSQNKVKKTINTRNRKRASKMWLFFLRNFRSSPGNKKVLIPFSKVLPLDLYHPKQIL